MYEELDSQKLVEKRKEMKYSIHKMAHFAHCDARTIRKLERGDYASCKLETLQRVIPCYGLPTPVLMIEKAEQEETFSGPEDPLTFTDPVQFCVKFVAAFQRFNVRIFKAFVFYFGLENYIVKKAE